MSIRQFNLGNFLCAFMSIVFVILVIAIPLLVNNVHCYDTLKITSFNFNNGVATSECVPYSLAQEWLSGFNMIMNFLVPVIIWFGAFIFTFTSIYLVYDFIFPLKKKGGK